MSLLLACPLSWPFKLNSTPWIQTFSSVPCSTRLTDGIFSHKLFQRKLRSKTFIVKLSSEKSDYTGRLNRDLSIQLGSHNFEVDKLRTHLGVIHPIPSTWINQKIGYLFVFFFLFGVAFDKFWSSKNKPNSDVEIPTRLSWFLEKDLQRKESVEWVNMVLEKLWKVYRVRIENWIIGLLQPVIDDLEKPNYVQRVEVIQFSLGSEPLSVRNVERITSRGIDDLQYQIGIRYTGDARMLLMLSVKFGKIPIVIPVTVRDFDIDGELWVKLRLIASEPWVGAASWAFVSLPKIKFVLSLFRFFNLMAIPVLSIFLTKLLTRDLPQLFVRPKKIDLDFLEGKAVGPVLNDFISRETRHGNKDYVGELSVTLVDAWNLSYVFYGNSPLRYQFL